MGKTNITYERYRFNNRAQEAGETINTYASALRALAESCEFGVLKDQLIRERIVCGISENDTRKKLLQESKLTLEKCMNICRAAESTKTQLKAMTENNSPPPREINFAKKGKLQGNRKPAGELRPIVRDCRYCGSEHTRNKEHCPGYGKTCAKCGKTNHFAVKCEGTRALKGSYNR